MRAPATADTADLAGRLRTVLAEEPHVVFAYLFGSMARGRARPSSDVDVAVMLDGEDGEALARIRADLATAVHPRRADVVALRGAPVALAYRVRRDGVLLLSRDERAREDHDARAIDRYLDMAPARRILAAGLRQRLPEGTYGRP